MPQGYIETLSKSQSIQNPLRSKLHEFLERKAKSKYLCNHPNSGLKSYRLNGWNQSIKLIFQGVKSTQIRDHPLNEIRGLKIHEASPASLFPFDKISVNLRLQCKQRTMWSLYYSPFRITYIINTSEPQSLCFHIRNWRTLVLTWSSSQLISYIFWLSDHIKD